MLGLIRIGVSLSFLSDSIPQVHRVFQYTNDFEEFWCAARDLSPRSSGLSVVSRANRNHFGSDLPFFDAVRSADFPLFSSSPAHSIPILGRKCGKTFFQAESAPGLYFTLLKKDSKIFQVSCQHSGDLCALGLRARRDPSAADAVHDAVLHRPEERVLRVIADLMRVAER